jgi:hypothetical protein
MEFKSFEKITNIRELNMTITQKIHGSNAQIHIYEEEGELKVKAGSRNRWVSPEDDNFGFARFVEDNKQEITEKLGIGTHYGEWAGPGINSGEGLKEKTLILFNHGRYDESNLPPRMKTVPILYTGTVDNMAIQLTFDMLKKHGSYLVEGFMRPEGIVVNISGKKFKKVFDAEETGWTKPEKSNKGLNKKEVVDYSYLCQPIRLQKLLSKDERYIREFPSTLGLIVKDYVNDLEEEGQIQGDKDRMAAIRKAATGQVFKFIKTYIEQEL